MLKAYILGEVVDDPFLEGGDMDDETIWAGARMAIRDESYMSSSSNSTRLKLVVDKTGSSSRKAGKASRSQAPLWATDLAVLVRQQIKEAGHCRSSSHLFLDSRGEKTPHFHKRLQKARDACKGCSVLHACAEYAIMFDERFGIWAGSTETGRDNIIKVLERTVEMEIDEIRSLDPDDEVRQQIRELLPKLIGEELNREVGTLTEERVNK